MSFFKIRGNHAFCAAMVQSVCPMALAQVPPPTAVSGKEYSNHTDEDALGNGDFLQNIAWDGFGGATDTFDYSNSGPPPFDPDQVDALANEQDLFFHEVRQGLVPFVTSFGGIGDIYSHTPAGAAALWASGPMDINQGAPPDDVDGLEVWGPSDQDDANHYSIIGDPIAPVPPGGILPISVYSYDPNSDTSFPYIFHFEVQQALGVSFEVDVDALMVFDEAGNFEWEPGDWIIFSLWPVGPFDGGEIWVWQNGLPAQFLVHGGVVWNTPNPVGAIFNVPTENINAFEAVPEPGTLVLLVLGAFGLAGRNRRKG